MSKSVVVKLGTSSVTDATGGVDYDVLVNIAADVVQLRQQGWQVVVVTSGAITAGWAEVGGGKQRPSDAATLQAVSAVGQPLLMHAWRNAFGEVGTAVGQVLLAPLDFSHRGQYLHARGTLESLQSLGVVPIVNENDAVADEEIRFGDNDRLAALVANLVGATHLVLLTDTDGLLTADPRFDPSATLIEEVNAIDADLVEVAGLSGSDVGSGGMASKLAAARMATWSGITTVIASARSRTALQKALQRQDRLWHDVSSPRRAAVGAKVLDRLRGREQRDPADQPGRARGVRERRAQPLARGRGVLRRGLRRGRRGGRARPRGPDRGQGAGAHGGRGIR